MAQLSFQFRLLTRWLLKRGFQVIYRSVERKKQTRRVKRAIKIFLRKKAGGKTRPGKNLSFYVWAGSRKHRKGERDKNRKVLHTEKPSVARKSSTTFLKDHSNCRDAGI